MAHVSQCMSTSMNPLRQEKIMSKKLNLKRTIVQAMLAVTLISGSNSFAGGAGSTLAGHVDASCKLANLKTALEDNRSNLKYLKNRVGENVELKQHYESLKAEYGSLREEMINSIKPEEAFISIPKIDDLLNKFNSLSEKFSNEAFATAQTVDKVLTHELNGLFAGSPTAASAKSFGSTSGM